MKRLIITAILFAISIQVLSAQTIIFDTTATVKQDRPEPEGKKYRHLLGVKAAYNISGMDMMNAQDIKSITTYENFYLSYTYYHPMWGDIDNFGIQISVSKLKQGYKSDEGTVTYDAFSVPFVSQFHIDFWKMRLLVNIGGFGGYRSNRVSFDGTKGFSKTDRRADFGIIGGGGFAFVFKPFEIHAEVNYQYSLSDLYDANRDDTTGPLFTYPHQLLISLGLHFHL